MPPGGDVGHLGVDLREARARFHKSGAYIGPKSLLGVGAATIVTHYERNSLLVTKPRLVRTRRSQRMNAIAEKLEGEGEQNRRAAEELDAQLGRFVVEQGEDGVTRAP